MKHLFTIAAMSIAVSSTGAVRADINYTQTTSMVREGKMQLMNTTTTWQKPNLIRNDYQQDLGMYKMQESSISDGIKKQQISIDRALKIYVIEPLNGASSTGSSGASTTPAKSGKRGTGSMTYTVGAQYLGLVKMLGLNTRHYKTSSASESSGCCGTGKTNTKTEVWMADVKIPPFNWPGGNDWKASLARVYDNCDVKFVRKGNVAGYEAAYRGLALKTIMFDANGKPSMVMQITKLSQAPLGSGVFGIPAGFKKVSRDEFNNLRQQQMMSAMSRSSNNSSRESSSNPTPTRVAAVKTEVEEVEPAELPTTKAFPTEEKNASPDLPPLVEPVSSAPVPQLVVKNDPKLDTALLNALRDNKEAEALAALQAGANFNARDKAGNTPLLLAAQNGKIEVVRTLMAQNVDVNAQNKAGKSALHLAAGIGAPQPKKKRFGGLGGLLGGMATGAVMSGGLGNFGARGAWASSMLGVGGLDNLLGSNLQGLLGSSAFSLTGRSGWSAIIGTALQGDLKAGGNFGMQNLIGMGAAGGRLSASNWVGMMSAVKSSNPAVLGAMSRVSGGNSALWSQFVNAASAGDTKTVETLMANKELQPMLAEASQGFVSAAGELPQNAALNIVKMLRDKGANVTLTDGDNQTAAQIAEKREWNEVATALR